MRWMAPSVSFTLMLMIVLVIIFNAGSFKDLLERTEWCFGVVGGVSGL